MISEAKRTTVLPALHYGRARIVEARIDQALFVVRKLNASDVAWLRQNEPEILRAKVARLGAGLIDLVQQIGDAR